jgi:hypothetical protein
VADEGDAGGRALHDIDVKDGIAYVSYWSDGLVILDVGNGMKGGTPTDPKLISNYKYNAEALYPGATADYGPGFISGTHTAWRHKNYVFIADEVFPPFAPTGTWDVSSIRAYGPPAGDRRQATSSIPKSVAWYEPEFGGVHNVWAAATRCTWARTTAASTRSTSRASCAAISRRRDARSWR